MAELLNLDLCITYRCNQSCRNCIEFCNLADITGLDYSDSDMTLSQILDFCDQIRATRPPPAALYLAEGAKNKAGRRITKRYHWPEEEANA